MSNIEKTIEMCRRVGLSRDFAMRLFYIALRTAQQEVDMVQVACAVKYASENRHLLKVAH
jgi:hypothetical protein